MISRRFCSMLVGALVAATTLVSPALAVDFLRGDADANGRHQISDGVRILGHLFLGDRAPDCEDAFDSNDSGLLDVADAVWLLNFLFLGGAQPPEPFLSCGADRTRDVLGCDRYEVCDLDPDRFPLWHVSHDGFECVRAPCPNWTARNAERDDELVTGVDVSLLELGDAQERDLVAELAAGRRIVRGYLQDEPAPDGLPDEFFRTLVVTEVVDDAGEPWHVFANGIVCVTSPCPSFTAENDRRSVRVSGLDVRPLGLGGRQEEAVIEEIQRGAWIVRGIIVAGPTGPAGVGETLVVLELLERVPVVADE